MAGTGSTDESTRGTSGKSKITEVPVTKKDDFTSVGSDDSAAVDEYDDDNSDDDIEVIEDHPAMCGCRCCEWDKIPAAKASKLPVLAQRSAGLYS